MWVMVQAYKVAVNTGALDASSRTRVCTYRYHEVVKNEQKPCDCRELKGYVPRGVLILSMHDLVIQKYGGRCNQVGKDPATDVSQGVLVERTPGRMRSSEKDGLKQPQ